jgi:hypothetical protein
MAPIPNVVGHRFGEGNVRVEIALAGDQNGRSDIGDISAGKACVDTDGENVGLLLVLPGRRQARWPAR